LKLKNYSLIFGMLLVLLIATCVLSICIGAVKINVAELGSIIAYRMGLSQNMNFQVQQEAVFFSLRLPRVILGMLVGSTLAISGATMQGLFRNPLADRA